MKNKMKHIIMLLLSFYLGFSIVSCDIKNPTEGIEVRVKNIKRTTTIRVQFLDAKTQKLVNDGSVTVNVNFEGQNKSDVITTVNEPVTTLSTKDGSLYFAIKDEIKPTIQNPVEVILVCNAESYLATSARIYLTEIGTHGISVNLVSLQNDEQPEGINTNEEQEGNTGSTGVTEEVNVSTGEGTDVSAAVVIPVGTKLKDKSGNILTGDITTRITYFDPTDQQALSSFPGGLNVNTENQGRGNFTSAGFVAVDMDVNGTDVSSFEGGNVNVQINVPDGLINPVTGAQVAPGDKIPLWSYDEANGKWNYEGEYTVASASKPGKLGVKIPSLRHLSFWNLDWFEIPDCDEGSTIHVDGCFVSMVLVVKKASDGTFISSYDISGGDPNVTLTKVSSDEPLVVEAYTNHESIENGAPLGSLTINDPCVAEIRNLVITSDEGASSINVRVRGVCPNGNVLDEGTLDVEVKKDGAWVLAGTIVDGRVDLCLVIGRTYDFRVYYDGEYYTKTFTVSSSNEDITVQLEGNIELCN